MERIKKKRWKQALIRNRITVIVLLLLQLGCIALLVRNTTRWSIIVQEALTLISLFAALYIVGKPGDPTAKLSWVFIILVVPVFGGLLYLVYAAQYRSRWIRSVLDYTESTFRPLFFPDLSALAALEQTEREDRSLMRYLEGWCGFPVYAHSKCTYYSPGESYYPVLLAALEKAEKYIFIETFILAEGEMWDSVLAVLTKKAAAGVDVRVMYDDVGCFLTLPRGYARTLRARGIKAQAFNPFRPFLSVIQNQRDHRKVISIDGKVAFAGGCNLADEYINRRLKYGYWKDAMLRVEGEAAWGLTLIGMQLWRMDITKEEIAVRCPFAEAPSTIETDGYAQPYGDNPLGTERVGENIYLQILERARDYVYIDTPYLVIDDTMLRALTLAAKSGVDVRIVVPSHPDHPLVLQTTRSYYASLLEAQVKVYEYTPGFMHTKLFVSDDRIAAIGSTNLDYRSLYQNFECGVVLYGSTAIADAKADYLETVEQCRRITAADCACALPMRLFRQILRLFAPLM